jgi:hypothetical protein
MRREATIGAATEADDIVILARTNLAMDIITIW